MAKASNTTRRLFLGSMAIMPATTAMPPMVGAGTPDPIFAAIEAHRQADRTWCDALRRNRTLEEERRNAAKCDALGQLEIEARAVLLGTVPTTLDGLVALVKHLRNAADDFLYDLYLDQFMRTIEAALEGMAVQA